MIWNKKIILALKGGIIIFYYDKKLYNTMLWEKRDKYKQCFGMIGEKEIILYNDREDKDNTML